MQRNVVMGWVSFILTVYSVCCAFIMHSITLILIIILTHNVYCVFNIIMIPIAVGRIAIITVTVSVTVIAIAVSNSTVSMIPIAVGTV
jgi:hypothetical protein